MAIWSCDDDAVLHGDLGRVAWWTDRMDGLIVVSGMLDGTLGDAALVVVATVVCD